MKPQFILLVAMLAFAAASLNAQIGPGRRPGDADDRPGGGKPGAKKKPAGQVQKPGPSGPVTPAQKPGPKVTPGPKPGPGPSPGPTRKILPGTPGTPPRSVGPGGRPAFPTVRKPAVPSGPSMPRKGARIINPPGPAGGPGAGIRLDPRTVRGVLGLAPRRIAPAIVVRPGVPRPGVPPPLVRVYDRTRNVVIVPTDDGQSTEMPYIAVPILFAVGTAELLDETSTTDLESLAGALLEVYAQDNNARFVIEGHTSTDGDDAGNLKLSNDRASRIYALLVSHYGVPAAILSIKGYGETYADHPNGSEAELQLDRRVLVVRTQ